MAPPTNFCRAIFFFADNEVSAGWSEQLYFIGSVSLSSFQAAYTLAQLRRSWLPSQFQMLWIRIDNMFNPRQFIGQSAGINGALPGTYTCSSVLPVDSRILVQSFGVNPGQVNRVFAGGVGSQDVSFQQFAPTDTWKGVFTPWAQALTGSTFWQAYNRVNGGISAQVPFTGFTPLSPRGNLITGANTSGMFNQQIIRISAPASLVQGLQGYKVVTHIVGSTSFNIGGTVGIGEIPNPGNAFYVPINPTMSLISQVRYERLTNRRSGRPFAQQVGRRSSRIPLRA